MAKTAHQVFKGDSGSYYCECGGTHGGRLSKPSPTTKGDVTHSVVNDLLRQGSK